MFYFDDFIYLSFCLGFITFFIVEKVVRILRNEKSTNNKHGHSHGIRKLSTEKLKNSDEDSDGNTEISNKVCDSYFSFKLNYNAYIFIDAKSRKDFKYPYNGVFEFSR